MIYPEFLKDDDVIGISAPSDGVVQELDIKRLDNAIKKFNDIGYHVVEAESVRKSTNGKSNDDSTRAREVEDLFKKAEEKGEAPFFILCDEIEDPHNLGAIIRTANLAGAHGVIIPKRRAVGLTSTVAKVSAGALNYTPVARVTNLSRTIDELKDKGMWFVCGDMGGELMYDLNLTGSIGLIIGNEGNGVSRLVKEKCDYVASIPMKGDIDSLNASVATGVLAFEIVRQRMGK